MDRFFKVFDIEVRTHKDLLNSNLLWEFFKFFFRCTIISITSLIWQGHHFEFWRIPVALDSKVFPVWAIIFFNAVHFNFVNIAILEVNTKLAIWERDTLCYKFSVRSPISGILFDIDKILKELERSHSRIIKRSLTIVIRQHKSDWYVFSWEIFRWGVLIWNIYKCILLNLYLVSHKHIAQFVSKDTQYK